MRRRYWVRWCVVVLFLWTLPTVVVAQEDGQDGLQEEDEVPAQASEADQDAPTAEGDTPAVEQEEGQLAEGEEEASAAEVDGDREDVRGPGGAPLRTDYPGTEESLQPRMDTGRIEGVEREEEIDPDEIYDLRVRQLETQIDDLKERVFRSKSRIALLRETILSEDLAGSRAIVTFVNDLGRRYTIERAIFSVDGSQVFSSLGTNGDFDQETEIFSGPMTPGSHTISVTLGLRGSGYGVFSYAEGYEFDLRFSCQFTAEEGQTTLVVVRSYKGGNAFTAHEERPDGICQVSMVDLTLEEFEEEVQELDTE